MFLRKFAPCDSRKQNTRTVHLFAFRFLQLLSYTATMVTTKRQYGGLCCQLVTARPQPKCHFVSSSATGFTRPRGSAQEMENWCHPLQASIPQTMNRRKMLSFSHYYCHYYAYVRGWMVGSIHFLPQQPSQHSFSLLLSLSKAPRAT